MLILGMNSPDQTALRDNVISQQMFFEDRRRSGGGGPALDGDMRRFDLNPQSIAIANTGNTTSTQAPQGDRDTQVQMRLLVVRERLRRAIFN